MKQYLELLQRVLDHGIEKKDRTGTGTVSVFGEQLRFDLREHFPLLTTKRVQWHRFEVGAPEWAFRSTRKEVLLSESHLGELQ